MAIENAFLTGNDTKGYLLDYDTTDLDQKRNHNAN